MGTFRKCVVGVSTKYLFRFSVLENNDTFPFSNIARQPTDYSIIFRKNKLFFHLYTVLH